MSGGKKRKAIEAQWAEKNIKGRQADPKYVAEPVQAKNITQKKFLELMRDKKVVVFLSPAGCGKSFLTMCECTDWLKKGIFDKLILTRPAVGMGSTLGLLPNGLKEKFEPYLLPCVDVICQRYGRGFYESSLHNHTIEFAPLEYIRGRSFSELVVLDEGQNTTPDELYTILTRIADGGKLIIIGDPNQNDIRGENGLQWLKKFINDNPELEEEIGFLEATSDDIVRSGLCKLVVKAKEKSK